MLCEEPVTSTISTQSRRVLSWEAVTILESLKANEQLFTESLCPRKTLIFTYKLKKN